MTYPPGPYGYGYPPPPPPPQPGVIPLAPLGLGQLLTGAFTTYGRYWKPLIGVAVAAYGAEAVLTGGGFLIAYQAVKDDLDRLTHMTPHTTDFADFQPLVLAFGGVWFVALLGLVVTAGLVGAAAPAVVQEAVLGRPVGFVTIWRRAWSRLGSVIGAVLLSALASVVPMVLFLAGFALVMVGMITGINASGSDAAASTGLAVAGGVLLLVAVLTLPLWLWLYVKFSLAPAVAVIENQGPVASLRRSAALVRGDWWRVFGYGLVAALIVGFISMLLQQIVSMGSTVSMSSLYGSDGTATPGEIISAMFGSMMILGFVQMLLQAVFAPFLPLVNALLYVDQRLRKENLGPILAQQAV
ncbi:oxidoreductase [Streptomyces sp. NPDC004327]|uniref:DUF7847 domain-containing protein n=1 Tax=Streptomyces sp. NPDC004327 TaxID=3364699 RepID=UPI0036C62B1A